MIDHLLISVGRPIVDERVNLLRRGWQAGQIEGYAANQSRPIGFGGRLQTFLLESGEDKRINGISYPATILYFGRRLPLGRDERPVLVPRRTLRDPLRQVVDILLGEFLPGGNGRHTERGILGRDAPHQLTLFRIARHDGAPPIPEIRECMGFGVEAQFALIIRGVRSVANEALVRKNRPNIPVKIDAPRSRSWLLSTDLDHVAGNEHDRDR